jgi:hypothetical protein
MEYTIEPTDNFKKEIIKIIEYFDEMNIKSSLVRDLKLVLLLELKNKKYEELKRSK